MNSKTWVLRRPGEKEARVRRGGCYFNEVGHRPLVRCAVPGDHTNRRARPLLCGFDRDTGINHASDAVLVHEREDLYVIALVVDRLLQCQ